RHIAGGGPMPPPARLAPALGLHAGCGACPSRRPRLEGRSTMPFHRWMQNLFGSRKPAIRRRPPCRLAIEELEDRRVPTATLSISDATLVEGNSGTTNAIVTVKLSNNSNPPVSVNYS